MDRKYIVRVFFALAAALLFWGLTQIESPQPPETEVVSQAKSKSNKGASEAAEASASSDEPNRQSLTDEVLRYAPPVAVGPLELPGEFILRFRTKAEYDAFLAEARRRGLIILGENAALHTLRISGDPDTFGPWYEQLARDAESFVNVPVLVPPFGDDVALPDFGDGGGGGAFGTGALAAIGVPTDNANWGAGVTIAVLDTALGPHPSLEGTNILFLDPLPAGAAELNGSHGTSVASLIAGNGAFGITGVAPASTLLSLPVLDAEGNGNAFTLADAIVRATDRGADVINLSLGAYTNSPVIQDAVIYAADRGVVLVASAGNDGSGALLYPAAYEQVISVAAADSSEHAAFFSNFGVGLDLAAPGVGVFAAGADGDAALFSGSSAAAPYVSGAVAGLLSLDPTLTPTQVTDLLTTYTNDPGPPGVDLQTGSGFLNVGSVLERDTPDIFDAAVADIFVDPSESTDTTAALTVTVQNRGTEPLEELTLVTVVDGTEVPFRIELLEPGQTDFRIIDIDRTRLTEGDGINVEAAAVPADRRDDRRANNLRQTQLRLLEPGE
ncbi:MAG: S8 family serine peptidase [Opitutales bacterium]